MNYGESQPYRRLVGRLSKGEYVVEALERLCRKEDVRAGAIRGVGVLRHVALQTYEAEGGYQTRLETEGDFELLSLQGNISTLGEQVVLNCYAQVATRTMGQWMCLGGRLFEAEAVSVEFVVDVFDDLVLERRLDARTGLPTWERIESPSGDAEPKSAPKKAAAPAAKPTTKPADKPAAKTPEPQDKPAPSLATKAKPKQRGEAFSSEHNTITRASEPEVVRLATTEKKESAADSKDGNGSTSSATWADAVQASEQTRQATRLAVEKPPRDKKSVVDDWPDMPELSAGDLLKHPHFGMCKILYVEEDDFVRVRMRSGKVLDIKLEVCELTQAGDKDGATIYDVKIVSR